MDGCSIHRFVAVLAAAAFTAAVASTALAGDVDPAATRKVKCDGKIATKVGTPGRDVFRGTARRDVIAGRGGNDIILGRGGNDIICGGAGNDRLVGGAGHDKLLGQTGRTGSSAGGRRQAFGGQHNDFLAGQAGPDVLGGGVGSDKLDGGVGVDFCNPGSRAWAVGRCELPKSVLSPRHPRHPRHPRRPSPCRRPSPSLSRSILHGANTSQFGGGFRREHDWLLGPLPWSSGDCYTGMDGSDPDDYFEHRYAMEFPLLGLPDGASVTKATLSVLADAAFSSYQALRGYPGNGLIQASDVEVAGTRPSAFSPRSHRSHRRRCHKLAHARGAGVQVGWVLTAGEPRASRRSAIQMPRVGERLYPILTIEYLAP